MICINMYVHLHTHAHTYKYIYIYMHTNTHLCIHVHSYLSMNLSIYLPIYIHIYIYICMKPSSPTCTAQCRMTAFQSTNVAVFFHAFQGQTGEESDNNTNATATSPDGACGAVLPAFLRVLGSGYLRVWGLCLWVHHRVG